ncbi:hypothetical protein [Myroides odoratus]|uniref:hypothetical protein n=1 Tax=Myroides odoratus TaxID=256 RepID=UPI0039B0D2AB
MGKKNSKSSVREVATAKQTGGGGFVFEGKAAAWFVAHFLADQFPFSPEMGKIKRIDFQVRPEGWLFDDLLLTLGTADGDIKVAISSKSNVQVNSKGPTDDLLNDLWNQYLGLDSKIFNPVKDYLCIVSAPLPKGVADDLNGLIMSAKTMDGSVFYDRISNEGKGFSKSKRDLFKLFHCPLPLAAAHGVKPSDTATVLSRLLLLEFDFQSDTSRDATAVIALARTCLKKPHGENEVRLYESMCAVRSELASSGGFIDYEKLVNRFRNKFDLIDYWNHVNDWEKIRKASMARMNSILDKIGNKVSLPLAAQIGALKEELTQNNVLFVLGKSGHGKSVLAKKFIGAEIGEHSNFIWIDSQSIEHGNLTRYFGLENSISDIIINIQQAETYLVIDGIDRFFKEEQLKGLYEILDLAIKPGSGWKVIITCQTDDYSDVIERLYRINIPLNAGNFRLSLDVYKHFPELREHFPGLSDLFKHEHLRSILNNLKYLDLMAFKLSAGLRISDKDLLGETTLIDWIWKEEIDSIGAANARLLQDYAEKQAQRFSASIPISDFNAAELSFLDALKQRKILYDVDDKLYLVHDLFGDWARYKLIRSNSENLNSYLLSKELASSLWRKAVRLYGIYLLEKNDRGASWIAFFRSLSAHEPKQKIIQDLLLESILFSASTAEHLITLFDFLKDEDGAMFKRFLDQFLMSATLPNQGVMKIAKDIPGITIAEAASYHRIPNYLYWPQVIEFLFSHKAEAIEFSRKKVAIICEMWLSNTAIVFPYREELAAIALENANLMFTLKHEGTYVRDDVDEFIYKAFLAGINEYPEGVIELSLKLCKRIKVERKPKPMAAETGTDLISSEPRQSIFSRMKVRDRVQWPDGPYENPDDAFEKICINSSAINPLILAYPEKAKEILLALFIEPPREISYGFDSTHYGLDINEPSQWFPPFYNRGPFLFFLKNQPMVGLRFVIALINFACEQWTNDYKHKQKEIPRLAIEFPDGKREYIGDSRIYFWYRDHGQCPHAIVSALQALEKLLIDTIDNDGPVSDYIDIVLREGNSTAYLGVINSVGRYDADLYRTALKPLLGILEFHLWEKNLDYGALDIEGHQMIGSNFYDRTTWKLAKEWNELPHRRRSITSTALTLYMSDSEIREYFVDVVSKWTALLTQIEDQGETFPYLTRLITFFNIENYEIRNDGTNTFFEYKEPESITVEFEHARAEMKAGNDLFMFPFKCLQDIEKGVRYDLEQSEVLWRSVQEIAETDDEDPYESFGGKHRSVLGGCAVMLYNEESWILEHPEIIGWIISYLEQVLDGYQIDSYGRTQADMGDSWTAFAARILGILWPGKAKDKQLRRQIGQLVLKSPYDTTNVLFTVVSKKLGWSDKNFVQVQNFLIQFSIGSDRNYSLNSRRYLHLSQQKEEQTTLGRFLKFTGLGRFIKHEGKGFDLDKYTDKILKAFIDNKTPTELVDWSKLRLSLPKARQHWRYEEDDTLGNEPGLDKKMLQHALVSMPSIGGLAISDRRHLLTFWKQVVEQITFELGDITEQSVQHDSYPHAFDVWAMEKIARVVLDIGPDDTCAPESFWQPIFDYGYQACEWIDRFLLYYFVNGAEKKVSPDRFFTELSKMIAFADQCTRWDTKRHYRGKDVWESLVGVSGPVLPWWKDDDCAAFFVRLVPETMKWGKKHSYDQDAVYKILYILRTKPGGTVLKDGIAIVNRHLNFIKFSDKTGTPDGYVRVGFKHEDFLAGTASHLWEYCKEQIKNDAELLAGFKETITFLVARQNLIGIELQERVIL